jgi:GR25 family glycosyltransferase involved in LPS biosynthesis
MRCIYINLADAADRRARIEATFARCAPAGWRLERLEASGPADVADIPGPLTPAEKGCFLSHRRALEAACAEPGDVMILEDDADFTARSFAVLEQLAAATEGGWELLWTDPSLMAVREFVSCAVDYPELAASGRFRVTDLRGVVFTGATAYVVREAAKRGLLDRLAGATFDRPYDLKLRDLVHAGEVRGAYVFPFVTTLAGQADQSTIIGQAPLHERARNLFRRLMFIDRDLAGCRAAAAALSERAEADDHAMVCSAILGALLAPQQA